jgi:Periplasmic glucan biosynthesis protein, MdoG
MVCLDLVVLVPLQLWAASAFDFAQVREQAQTLARQSFQERTNRAPATLRNLNYVQSQSIQFRRGHGLWAQEGLPFQAPTKLALEEAYAVMDQWFGRLLPEEPESRVSIVGRVSMSIIDATARWPNVFLAPGQFAAGVSSSVLFAD